ncbi:unnamed protein product, partial [Mesorhabditis belari]|uniref:Sulfotransferase n=1 Tax=Mesorhabditis belari TaxID=2138241 RepID=A0AAF3FUV5_9BILA
MTKQILCELTLIWKKLGKPYNHQDDQLFHEFCENHLWFDWIDEMNDEWDDSMGEPTHFIVVRDPIDRFTSMFGYVCGLYKNCGQGTDSIHVTAQLVYEMLMYEREPIGLNDLNQFKHHFEPHTWYCDIGLNRDLYEVVYYSPNRLLNMAQMQKIFDQAGIPIEYSKRVS